MSQGDVVKAGELGHDKEGSKNKLFFGKKEAISSEHAKEGSKNKEKLFFGNS